MMKKILIANRGEIAVRIIKACKELGIKTVAVYSEIDKNALHVHLADESYCIGEAVASETYLNMDKIIEIARISSSDAIHPGYGFLSENYLFNQKVLDAGLIFIGPNPESMRLLGSKVESRELMIANSIPVAPGMKSSSDNIQEFIEVANRIGYPVLIKASAGGGGKGMRIVHKESDLLEALQASQREAKSAFGDDSVFMEKYISKPRHIEFQIAADHHGNCIHINERECSIQRRHQKIIEETPSTALNSDLRKKMGEIAIKAVKAANYDSIGTVEFLLDENGDFYFLEVNARVQVEHPITEMTSGIDLVKLQISIAQGETINILQDDISHFGHSIECRLYAEDGDNNFMPSSGKILFLNAANGPGIRFDSGIQLGSDVSVYYDPILAKLIVWGRNREEARIKMINALKNTVILGVKTSSNFMIKALEHKDFISGETFTSFINDNMHNFIPFNNKEMDEMHALSLYSEFDAIKSNNGIDEPWQTIGQWEICSAENTNKVLSTKSAFQFSKISKNHFKIIDNSGRDFFKIEDKKHIFIFSNGKSMIFDKIDDNFGIVDSGEESSDVQIVKAPMPGNVVKIMVDVNDEVVEGQALILVEAMKMEMTLYSSINGKVESINVETGKQLEADEILMKIWRI